MASAINLNNVLIKKLFVLHFVFKLHQTNQGFKSGVNNITVILQISELIVDKILNTNKSDL